MRDIVGEGPEAERVVMTMAYTYKAAGQPEGITAAYAAAAERQPRDPEVLGGLFKAHARWAPGRGRRRQGSVHSIPGVCVFVLGVVQGGGRHWPAICMYWGLSCAPPCPPSLAGSSTL